MFLHKLLFYVIYLNTNIWYSVVYEGESMYAKSECVNYFR
jgi:hypothetical protein